MRGAVSSVVAMVAAACTGPPAKVPARPATTVDKSAIAAHMPAELVATGEPPGPIVVARIRVYADQSHRASVMNWERVFRRRAAHLGELLEAWLGLRLEIADARVWPGSGAPASLEEALTALEQLDSGTEVNWVVGLVDSDPGASGDLDQLVRSRPLGAHIVIRGSDPSDVAGALDREGLGLSEAEREVILTARRAHREMVALLHGIGHSLGALHVDGGDALMAARYARSQARFEPVNLRMMRLVLERWAAGDNKAGEARRAVLDFLASESTSDWAPGDVEALRAELEARAAADARTSARSLAADVRPEDRDRFVRARRLADAGKRAEAWEIVETLIQFYPDDPEMTLLACELLARREGAAVRAAEMCRSAAAGRPRDPRAHLVLGDILAKTADHKQALTALDRGRGLLDDSSESVQWERLARSYQQLGAVTRAEETAARAGLAARDVAAWVAETRARFALPTVALTPQQEKDYVDTVKETLQRVYGRDFPGAERGARELARRYPDLPGASLVRCDLDIRRRRYPQARSHCERALARYDGAAWGHYLMGLLDNQRGDSRSAIAHLERAIELYERLQHAYVVLGQLYKTASPSALARLQARHEKVFGSELRIE